MRDCVVLDYLAKVFKRIKRGSNFYTKNRSVLTKGVNKSNACFPNMTLTTDVIQIIRNHINQPLVRRG